MVDKTIEITILTPQRSIFTGQVRSLIVPAHKGYLGILPGHAPFLCMLTTGEIIVRESSSTEDKTKRSSAEGWREPKTAHFATSGGLMEVLPGKVSILTDSAEKLEEIDTKRVESARNRAIERIKSRDHEIDIKRAQDSLERAENRLKILTRRNLLEPVSHSDP